MAMKVSIWKYLNFLPPSSAVVMEKSKTTFDSSKMLHMENQLWHILTN